MGKYFCLDEFVRSSVAAARGIDNTPPAAAVARLRELTESLLDPIREAWGAPLTVTSGYRCAALNAAVGGASSSQHLLGEAADITTGSAVGNRLLFELIVAGGAESPSDEGCENRRSCGVLRPAAQVRSARRSNSTSPGDSPERPENGNKTGRGGRNVFEFDQLIDEKNYQWLHLSFRAGRNRLQILHL